MQRTKIEYLTHTWNPLAMRCTPVSSGCDNCWHLRMANRLAHIPSIPYDEQWAYAPKTSSMIRAQDPILRTKELTAPLKLKKPAIIGTQFMGDLFHEDITNEQIAAVFGVMAACPQRTFCALTKRPERMARFFIWLDDDGPEWTHEQNWPLPNVWLGVSVEDQPTADERIPWLLKTPAAKWFVSCEPLLGAINIPSVPDGKTRPAAFDLRYSPLGDLDWVIAGAETGPGKRPADLDWFRSLRDQCAAADVPFFFKQDSSGSRELDGRIHEEMPATTPTGGRR